jgi:hypothetical protein
LNLSNFPKRLFRGAAFAFALSVLLAGALPARADQFVLTYSGAGISGDIDLTATNEGNGEYLVTAATGTQNGQAITFLPTTAPLGQDTYVVMPDIVSEVYYDDLLFPTSNTLFDDAGLAFDVPGLSDGQAVNIFSTGTGSYVEGIYTNSGSYATDFNNVPLTLSLVAAPEASSIVLLASGLLVLMFASWRKSRNTLPAFAKV